MSKKQMIDLNGVSVPLEDLRRDALEHYQIISARFQWYNSFVVDAIKAYNPARDAEIETKTLTELSAGEGEK